MSDFYINNGILVNQGSPKEFRVPQISTNDTLALAGKIGISQLFGIGISQKIITVNNDHEYDVRTDKYDPDARPNSTGGYDSTPSWDGYMSSSLAGMPVMCYLKFVGDTYLDIQGNKISIPDIIFETVLINLSMGRNIEKNKVRGRSGEIKEFISIGDWTVDIRAIITADAPVNSSVTKKAQEGVYPYDNMNQIWKMLQAPLAIRVECKYLNQFDIKYLVVDEGVRIEQVEGEWTMQRISIPCLSDRPLIIKTVQ